MSEFAPSLAPLERRETLERIDDHDVSELNKKVPSSYGIVLTRNALAGPFSERAFKIAEVFGSLAYVKKSEMQDLLAYVKSSCISFEMGLDAKIGSKPEHTASVEVDGEVLPLKRLLHALGNSGWFGEAQLQKVEDIAKKMATGKF